MIEADDARRRQRAANSASYPTLPVVPNYVQSANLQERRGVVVA